CTITSCNYGYSDCDGIDGNGCETNHLAYANTCDTAEYVGAACGDITSGTFCTLHPPFSTFATRTGHQGRWFRAHATECSVCPAELQARITLTVPAGIDFDLYAYRPCATLIASSTNGTGQQDQT